MPRSPDDAPPELLFWPLRTDARITIVQAFQMAVAFAAGASLTTCAEISGLSRKTVHEMALKFRDYLLRPEFDRWHDSRKYMLNVGTPEQEEQVWLGAFSDMALCHDNQTCYRNFTLGNRQVRLCRSCPLTNTDSNPDDVRESIAAIDGVRAFYEALGWRDKAANDPVRLFRLKFIHAQVVIHAIQNTRTLLNSGIDVEDNGPLSVSTLGLNLTMAAIADGGSAEGERRKEPLAILKEDEIRRAAFKSAITRWNLAPPTRPRRPRLALGLSLDQISILATFFAAGFSLQDAAAGTGIAEDAVNKLFRTFRSFLARPAFRRWAQFYPDELAAIPAETRERLGKLFEVIIGQCYENDACRLEFASGRRECRICENCPIKSISAFGVDAPEVLGLLDRVRAFYANLGWRDSPSGQPGQRFGLHLRHFSVIQAALAHTSELNETVTQEAEDLLGMKSLAFALIDELSIR